MRNAERGVLLNFLILTSAFCRAKRGKLPPTVIVREFRGGPLNAFRFFCEGPFATTTRTHSSSPTVTQTFTFTRNYSILGSIFFSFPKPVSEPNQPLSGCLALVSASTLLKSFSPGANCTQPDIEPVIISSVERSLLNRGRAKTTL